MKRQLQFCFSIAVAGTVFFSRASFAQGGPSLIGNGSFEVLDNSNPDLVISPWRWSYSLILFVGNPAYAAEGTNSAQVCGLIYQDVAVHPGTSYQLRFAFGGNDGNQVNLGPLTVNWGTQTHRYSRPTVASNLAVFDIRCDSDIGHYAAKFLYARGSGLSLARRRLTVCNTRTSNR